jgi:hypothetical protein
MIIHEVEAMCREFLTDFLQHRFPKIPNTEQVVGGPFPELADGRDSGGLQAHGRAERELKGRYRQFVMPTAIFHSFPPGHRAAKPLAQLLNLLLIDFGFSSSNFA